MNTESECELDPELDLPQEPEPDQHWFRPYLICLLVLLILIVLRISLMGLGSDGKGSGNGTGQGFESNPGGGETGSGQGEGKLAEASLDVVEKATSESASTASEGLVEEKQPQNVASSTTVPQRGGASTTTELQWTSDHKLTPLEKQIYQLACAYISTAVAEGAKIRFPDFGTPSTAIRKNGPNYEVEGFFRIESPQGKIVDYRYTLSIDNEITTVLRSSTKKIENTP